MRHFVDGAVAVAKAPPRRVSGQSRRASNQTPRRRKLSSEQEAAIRANVRNRTLCELAAKFGVGHETIRMVLHQESSAVTKTR